MTSLGVGTFVGLVFLLMPVMSGAQDWSRHIESETAKVESRIVELRRRIHQNPELSNREEKTAQLVAEHLKGLGLEVQTKVAHHGVIGLLRGGKPGPVVAVRADMDALPVTEETTLPFKSTVRTQYLGQEVGVMHACGHDVHTAVQLGVAEVLAARRQDLPGTVKFIFQPAEEGAPPPEKGGASLMIEEGALENPKPQAIFGLHTFAEMGVGTVGYTHGASFAAADTFEVKIIGKQAHAADPHLSIDPIVAASQFVLALQTIRSRVLPPLAPSVVTVGTIQGGQRHNIIPAEVTLSGTIRSYSVEVQDKMEATFRRILKGVADASGASFEVVRYDRITPAVMNDPALTRMSIPVLQRVVGERNVLEIPPTMGGEDFAYFANAVPGFFYRLGTVKPGGASGGHHTPTFLADDSSIPVGIKAMSSLVIEYLTQNAKGR
jgi:amidohydrolase